MLCLVWYGWYGMVSSDNVIQREYLQFNQHIKPSTVQKKRARLRCQTETETGTTTTTTATIADADSIPYIISNRSHKSNTERGDHAPTHPQSTSLIQDLSKVKSQSQTSNERDEGRLTRGLAETVVGRNPKTRGRIRNPCYSSTSYIPARLRDLHEFNGSDTPSPHLLFLRLQISL